MTPTPNEFVRSIDVRAPRERVWAALTEPELLLGWFPTHAAEVDLRERGRMRFAWETDADEAVIDELAPPERFVFRWRPEGSERPYTTVTILLRDVGDGTTELTLTETGFAELPDPHASFRGNEDGWAKELEELTAFLEGRVA
jgi:uncharacterized protein YndB with AHSA1/START domain